MENKSVAKDARWIRVCMHYLPELEPDYESLGYERFKRPEGGGKQSKLWSEIVGDDGTRCLNPGEDLSDADLRDRDGDLDRHVRGYAKAAILVADLTLRVGMGGRNHTATMIRAIHNRPRRVLHGDRGCDFVFLPSIP